MYSAWDKTNLELNMIYCTSSQTFITQDHIILKNLLQILNHSLCGFCIVIFIILKIKAENVYYLMINLLHITINNVYFMKYI